MIKTRSILHKKLQELQSLLKKFTYLSPESPYRCLLTQDIEQRFVFLKSLLSAEIASQSGNPYHLEQIDQRLSELETTFRELDAVGIPAEEVLDGDFEKLTACSCTESCFDDRDGGEDGEETEKFTQGLDVGLGEKVDIWAAEKEEKRCWAWSGKYVRFLVGVSLVGFVMLFSRCFEDVEKQYYLVPT